MTRKRLVHRSTRRAFLRNSAAAVAGGALAGPLLVPAGVHAGADDTLRLGLIGCGGRGVGAALNALTTKGPIKLVAMGDTFEFRVRDAVKSIEALLAQGKIPADRFDAPPDRLFVGWEAYRMVLAAGVDAVILAAPQGFRPLHFEAAVAAGKHVFMEKPAAVDSAGVRKILAVNKQAKLKRLAVAAGFNRRHSLSIIETVKRLREGGVGKVRHLEAAWKGPGLLVRKRADKRPGIVTEMQYQVHNWYYFVWLSGDIIVDQLSHQLDVANWIKGDHPIRAKGRGGRRAGLDPDYGEIFDHFLVDYSYADGSSMRGDSSQIPEGQTRVALSVTGEQGTAEVERGTILDASGNESWRYRGGTNNPYQREFDVFIESIRAGSPINEADDGAVSTLTAIMGRMAAYSGREVTWEQALDSPESFAPERYDWDAAPPALRDKFGNPPTYGADKILFY
jgi:predicted dehydrogenase